MATTQCAKCGSHGFEMVHYTPKGSRFKLNFVQCSSCGAVVGVLDYYNIGNLIAELGQKLGVKLTL